MLLNQLGEALWAAVHLAGVLCERTPGQAKITALDVDLDAAVLTGMFAVAHEREIVG
jgi:hypothetical protein